MGALDFLGGDRSAAPIRQIEAVARVRHQDHVPSHVCPGSNGRRHAHVGRDSEGDDVLRTQPLQSKIEIRTDEGGVHALSDELLAFQRDEPGTEGIAGGSWRKRGTRLNGIVPHMDYRSALRTPRLKQSQAVRIHSGIPATRPGGTVERLLHVDGKENGAVKVECHGVRNKPSVSLSLTKSANRPISGGCVCLRWQCSELPSKDARPSPQE